MTDGIAQKTCTPCRGGVAPLTQEAAEGYLSQTPGWELEEAHLLRRKFKFADFRQSLGFIDKVARLAEKKGIIPTSASAGVMRQFRCRLTRSRDCTRTISSWPRRSTCSPVRREALGSPTTGTDQKFALMIGRLARFPDTQSWRLRAVPKKLLISDPTISPEAFPRPSTAKCQVLQIPASPAMTRCRPASVPLDSE